MLACLNPQVHWNYIELKIHYHNAKMNIIGRERKGIFSPKAKHGKSKYGPNNGLVIGENCKDLPIAASMANALSKAANCRLSAQTWSSYKTSKNHLPRCQSETNVLITFPQTTKKVLVFISWFLFTRKANSAEVYISGLRCLHLINGHENPPLSKAYFEWTKSPRKN